MTAMKARRVRKAGPGPGARGRAGPDWLADVARGGTLNLAGAAVAAVSAIAVTVLITRHFSKPAAGAVFTAISLFLIVESAASLGAYVGAVNFIARLRRLGHDWRIPAILHAAIIPVTAVSITAAVILLLLAGPLAHALLTSHLGRAGASPAVVTNALRALAIALPFAALSDTLLGATRGYRDMRPTVVIDRLGRSAGQLLGVLVAVVAGSVALLAPLWALPYVMAAAAGAFWLRRIRRRQQPHAGSPQADPAAGIDGTAAAPGTGGAAAAAGRGGTAPAAVRPTDPRSAGVGLGNATFGGFWRFTAPRALANLGQITIQRIDIVLVAIMRGLAAAAIYTAATRFLVAGQFANSALNMAAQPRFAELFAVDDRRGASVVYRATTAWLILLTWPLYLLAVIYGPEILSVFGHSYRAGHVVMIILGVAMLVATACGQVDMVLITTGRSSWSLANGLMAVLVNVGLDLLLIPRYGIAGAAIGWAAAIGVTNLTPLIQLVVVTGLHPFGRGTLTASSLAVVSFGAIPLAARAVLGDGAAVSAGAVAAGCAVLAAGLWRFRGTLRLSALPGLARLGQSRSQGRRSQGRRSRGRRFRVRSTADPQRSPADNTSHVANAADAQQAEGSGS